MQENEFDKQVKSMMEEFSIAPPAAAWENVRRRITVDKRKKRYFLFFFLAGLITAGYLIYMFNDNTNSSHLKQDNEAATADKQEKDSVTSNIDFGKINKSDPGVASTTNILKQTLAEKNDVNNSAAKPASIKKNKTQLALKNYNKNQQLYTDNETSKKLSASNTENNNEKNSNVLKTDVADDNINKPASPFLQSNLPNVNTSPADSAIIKNNTIVTADSLLNKEQVATNQLAPNQQKNKNKSNVYSIPKWQWGIAASYSRSNLITGLNSATQSLSADLYASPGFALNAPATAVMQQRAYSFSNAYQVGFLIKRRILKNAVIESGVKYTQLSVKSRVQSLTDTTAILLTNADVSGRYTISRYYNPGNNDVYNNTYNFIELPVLFQQNIFHTKTTALSYNAGFSIRQLLSSKALVYDKNSNVFVSKQDLFNKTQFQLQSGLQYTINTGKKTSVLFGPQLSYSLSNSLSNRNFGNQHFINYGLQAGLQFHKK